jgi:hypothetical protein
LGVSFLKEQAIQVCADAVGHGLDSADLLNRGIDSRCLLNGHEIDRIKGFQQREAAIPSLMVAM